MNDAELFERILQRVDQTDTCWLWLGHCGTFGYGRIASSGKTYSVHRIAYQAAVGSIPRGLVLDHLCGVRNCVRPDHLEPVTQRTNTRRGRNSLDYAGTCKRGHDTTQEGAIILIGGRRRCKRCFYPRPAA